MANDNTVQFDHTTLQLLPDTHRFSYARANVEVQERLDGSLVVVHQGRTLASEPAPPAPVTLRARNGRRSNGHIHSNGEKWLRKSEQGDKWNRCLIEGMIVLSETGARDEQTTPP